MKNLLLILLLVPALAFSQQNPYKTKFKYRDAPKTGEWLCIAGIGLIALSATVLHNEHNPNLSKIAGYTGGTLIYAGVVVDFSSKGFCLKSKSKMKYRKFRVRF
ncbi:MAG TPA: hypothetical protein DCL77_14270 [Prolixibacteraceae bacterium]|nr:hypothetical protein [Prolixibacteraceae bacterium]